MNHVVQRKSRPTISVLMPIYNVEEYIEEAMISILTQTFEDFEFLIVDDGSTDGTHDIVQSFKDDRIRFFRRSHMGTVYQLNFGLKQVRGTYIARQDGDDRSHPERLEKQVAFLENHPAYAVLSTAMELIDERGEPIGVIRYPREPDYDRLMEKCCLSHPASMWRTEIHDKVKGYDEEFNRNCCEDYDFWLRVVEHFRIYVLDEVFYTKREHSRSSINQTRWTYVPACDEMARTKARIRNAARESIDERRL